MKNIIIVLIFMVCGCLYSQKDKPFEVNEKWLAKIEQLAPSTATVENVSKKKLLVFSKATGYVHWAITHTVEVLKILGNKSNSFELYNAYDIDSFDADNLMQYDAIVLNNCNPSNPDRDLFSDLLIENSNLPKAEIDKLSERYQENLMNYVKNGGGLIILHGGITVQNNSMVFSKMTGGSFDYHPKQQTIHLKEFDKNHALTTAFKGQGFIHTDEPYFFKNAYSNYDFRPLLYFEIENIKGMKAVVTQKVNYAAWIKRYGEGRVFYSSPAHNAQSFEQPELLKFLLDGIQYSVGDLQCDDSPIGK